MKMRAPISPAFVLVNTAMLWLTTAIAATALWPIYQAVELVILVGVVILVGSAVAILGAVFRLPSLVIMIATIAVYFGLGVPLAVPGRALYGVLPSGDGLLELLAGTALGWKQLLTVTLPVGSYQSLLVPAFVMVLITVVVGLTIALRARYGELAPIAPIALFIAAILFGPEKSSWPLELSLGLLISSLTWLIWRRWYRRRESIQVLAAQGGGRALEARDSRLGYRAIIGAGLTLAIAAAAGATATALLPPTAAREVLRTSIEQPFDPRDYASPLSGFRAYHQVARATDPMFTVSGLPADSRIRLATLDSYDGIVYSVGSDQVSSASGSFTRVPTSFDQSAVSGQETTIDVTIDGYAGVWMPTIGKFESVGFASDRGSALRDSFFYNDNSGTAAVVAELGSGDSYRLTAVVPEEPSPSELTAVEPGTAELPQIGVVPDELSATLNRYVADVQGSGARLQAMIAGLRAEGYISHGVADNEPVSRSGHAADRITQLLSGQRMIGDEEQYAVTAALMARELGFPARVVIGFVPANIQPDGVTVVRGNDISAWIEVNTLRDGWVTIDPTPPVREIPEQLPEDPTQVARPQSPVQPPVTEPDITDEQFQPDSTGQDPVRPDGLLALILMIAQVIGWIVVGIAVLLAPFLSIAAAKLRRRFLRKRAATPVQRISGGWQEFADAIVDHGFRPPPSPTRTEIAGTTGGVRSLVLAAVADRAAFAPEAVKAEEADQVWIAVEDLRASLSKGATRWQRIKALVSVRSLGDYSVKDLFR